MAGKLERMSNHTWLGSTEVVLLLERLVQCSLNASTLTQADQYYVNRSALVQGCLRQKGQLSLVWGFNISWRTCLRHVKESLLTSIYCYRSLILKCKKAWKHTIWRWEEATNTSTMINPIFGSKRWPMIAWIYLWSLQKYKYIWSYGAVLNRLEMLHNKHFHYIKSLKNILSSEETSEKRDCGPILKSKILAFTFLLF